MKKQGHGASADACRSGAGEQVDAITNWMIKSE